MEGSNATRAAAAAPAMVQPLPPPPALAAAMVAIPQNARLPRDDVFNIGPNAMFAQMNFRGQALAAGAQLAGVRDAIGVPGLGPVIRAVATAPSGQVFLIPPRF
jgi:hypothetical protein